jgi:hypothetical protein
MTIKEQIQEWEDEFSKAQNDLEAAQKRNDIFDQSWALERMIFYRNKLKEAEKPNNTKRRAI